MTPPFYSTGPTKLNHFEGSGEVTTVTKNTAHRRVWQIFMTVKPTGKRPREPDFHSVGGMATGERLRRTSLWGGAAGAAARLLSAAASEKG